MLPTGCPWCWYAVQVNSENDKRPPIFPVAPPGAADLLAADRLYLWPLPCNNAAVATDMQPPGRVPLSAAWFVVVLMLLIFSGS